MTEMLGGPGAGSFPSYWQSKDNVSEQNGGQRVFQCLRKRKQKEKTPTKGLPIQGGSGRTGQS